MDKRKGDRKKEQDINAILFQYVWSIYDKNRKRCDKA